MPVACDDSQSRSNAATYEEDWGIQLVPPARADGGSETPPLPALTTGTPPLDARGSTHSFRKPRGSTPRRRRRAASSSSSCSRPNASYPNKGGDAAPPCRHPGATWPGSGEAASLDKSTRARRVEAPPESAVAAGVTEPVGPNGLPEARQLPLRRRERCEPQERRGRAMSPSSVAQHPGREPVATRAGDVSVPDRPRPTRARD
jgi:hypothetical protein